eukprot:g25580.t1
MLIVIDNVLKAAKNMVQFVCSQEVLDDKGYPIGRISGWKLEKCSIMRLSVGLRESEVLRCLSMMDMRVCPRMRLILKNSP